VRTSSSILRFVSVGVDSTRCCTSSRLRLESSRRVDLVLQSCIPCPTTLMIVMFSWLRVRFIHLLSSKSQRSTSQLDVARQTTTAVVPSEMRDSMSCLMARGNNLLRVVPSWEVCSTSDTPHLHPYRYLRSEWMSCSVTECADWSARSGLCISWRKIWGCLDIRDTSDGGRR
jgi:hypothetical protein